MAFNRLRLPAVGGLVKVLATPANPAAAIANLQQAVGALNTSVQIIQSPPGGIIPSGPGPAGPAIRGRQGEDGDTGRQGRVGLTGAAGAPGVAIRGRQGDKGEAGRQGRIGLPGMPGAPGVGLRGRQGDEGDRGAAGIPGLPGAAGAAGTAGAAGSAGSPGRRGEDGEAGRRGVPGIPGAAGSPGAQGSPGVAVVREGIEGDPGRRGVPGTPGAAGAAGSPGAQGLPGVPARRQYHDEPNDRVPRRWFDPRNIDGPVTITAGAAGAALTINSPAGRTGILVAAPSGQNASFSVAAGGLISGTTSLDITQGSDGTAYIFQRSNKPLYFYTSNSQRGSFSAAGEFYIGPATVGKLGVLSANANVAAGLTAWSDQFSVFGPNAGSATGAALGLGYDTTAGQSVIFSLAPNVAWEPLLISASNYIFQLAGTTTAAISSAGAWRWYNYGAGSITSDGSGNLTAVSDERVKTNIRPFVRGLRDVLKLKPILHGYTVESGLDQTKDDYAGFSAQNVQSVMPEAVGQMADGMLTLNDRAILAAVVNAIHELERRP